MRRVFNDRWMLQCSVWTPSRAAGPSPPAVPHGPELWHPTSRRPCNNQRQDRSMLQRSQCCPDLSTVNLNTILFCIITVLVVDSLLVAVLTGNGITFEDKARAAQEAGAVGLLVIQRGVEWPFMMPGAGNHEDICIPVSSSTACAQDGFMCVCASFSVLSALTSATLAAFSVLTVPAVCTL